MKIQQAMFIRTEKKKEGSCAYDWRVIIHIQTLLMDDIIRIGNEKAMFDSLGRQAL